MKVKNFIGPVISIILLIIAFTSMQRNYTNRFAEVNKRYNDGIAVNLDKKVHDDKLADILHRNGYAESQEDAQFIAKVIKSKLNGDTIPDAITDLNKRKWQVSCTRIEAEGTDYFRRALELSRTQLGQTEYVDSLYIADNIPANINIDEGGNGSITVNIRLPKPESLPAARVMVLLEKHWTDSTNKATSAPLAYAMTDKDGMARFTGLDEYASYSVLPIKKDYEFGTPKGTTKGSLAEADDAFSPEYTFIQQPHTLRLFTSQTLQRIKEDATITVRTPQEFTDTTHLYFILFMVAWLWVFIAGNVRKRTLDNNMASLLMLVTGFSLIHMFGINDVLTERLLGVETAQGIIAGVLIAGFFQCFNIMHFYQDTLHIWPSKKNTLPFDPIIKILTIGKIGQYDKWKGFGYMLFALLLTAMLFPFGQAIGGMKVNLVILGLPVQPSEIAKFAIILFLAAWFCRNGESITRYSEEGAQYMHTDTAYINRQFLLKLKKMGWLLACIILLLGIYMILGDMGPAMIVILTFIIIYSIVKSRKTIQGCNDSIFTCDIAYLILGSSTFIVLLFIGHMLDIMGILAVLWFIGWYFFGIARKKIHESAILFNLVISAFVFGPVILSGTSVGERLASRNEMCTNTWGDLALDGGIPAPTVNTQVAEGLWGLASGGLTGQGIGNGSQHFIPAFHTDFILESIGEQLGFIGLSFLIVIFSLLLWKALLAGFHSRHHFTLYICTGIAVVTGVQFIIIALGSTGICPLTGVAVPFFSFGRVSTILNLAAFGLVLSVTSHCRETKKISSYMQAYSNPILITILSYIGIIIFILGVFFHYQVINRDATLLRPVFVYNTEGAAILQYNPRIEKVASRMKPGNIYDRKGILLATSFSDSLTAHIDTYKRYGVETDFRKVQERYYPFGENLFFMLGNYNNKLYFSSVDNSPRGYMVEARHLAELRGYDNVLRNPDGSKKQVDLFSQKYKPGKFLPANSEFRQDGYQLRDYSALLPYLKAGYASGRIQRFNERNEGILDFGQIEPKDLHLTIDAGLQTHLQQALGDYIKDTPATKAYSHLQRTSVVVIDAESGDLLASANWPLPEYNRLAEETEPYNDKFRKKGEWTAYTDMDLGVIFATPPGSTAKVMSALAGLRSLAETNGNIEDKVYSIYADEIIHTGAEPFGQHINMHRAIVESSNIYFINLVNEMNLYDELAHIYESAGISIGMNPSYKINYNSYNPQSGWKNRVTGVAEKATSVYRDYISQRKANDKRTHRHMTFCEPWRWAWGQGNIDATPLAMARVAATVVNDGEMPITRFLLTEEPQQIHITSKEQVASLKEAMRNEAHKLLRDGRSRRFASYPTLGGKTGTPERNLNVLIEKKRKSDTETNTTPRTIKANDGWYICFVENAQVAHKNKDGEFVSNKAPLAIAVRVERSVYSGSSYAKNIADKLVMDILSKEGYFN